MSQVTTGLLSLLSVPLVYETFQHLMGAHEGRKTFVSRFIEPYPVNTILDIGCGPAGILAYLPDVDYYGFDISESYIAKAKETYGSKGHFFAKQITDDDIDSLPEFDVVLLSGVLHHVDDGTAVQILKLAYQALKPGARLITIDGCLVEGQNIFARYLIKHDRGKNIKTEDGYVELARNVFEDVDSYIHHRTWIPYTLCYMVCTR